MNVKLVAAAVSAAAMAGCSPDLSLQAEAPPRTTERPAEGATTAAATVDKAAEAGNKGN